MSVAAEQPVRTTKEGHLPLSGFSVLLALALAVWELYFFWGAGKNLLGLDGTLGLFTPDRLGFNIAWLMFCYLAFQLISIPFAMTYREQFVGVLDGLASVVPLFGGSRGDGRPSGAAANVGSLGGRGFARPHELG